MLKHGLIWTGLLVCGLPSMAQWEAHVHLASDYIYRGESLTGGQPALQADVTYSRPHLMGGLWHSYVRRPQGSEGDAAERSDRSGAELALFGGLTTPLCKRVTLSFIWFGYTYPDNVFADTDEGYLGLEAYGLDVRLWRNEHLRFTYSEAGFQRPLSDRLALVLHAGHKRWDNAAQAAPASATDWLAGIKLQLSGMTLDLAVSDLSRTPASRQVTLMLSKSFSL